MCVAQVQTINIIYQRFKSFLVKALSSSNLISTIFTESAYFVNCFTGYNFHYGHLHVRCFHDTDISIAYVIRLVRSTFGLFSDFESLISRISCQ